MIITRINEHGSFDMSTEIVHRNNAKKHHNIKFGNRSKGLWRVTFGIDKRIANIDNNPEPVWLDKTNYILNPVMKDGRQIMDAKNNGIYYIGIEKNIVSKDINKNIDVLAFIEIPNNFYRQVTYKVTGECMVIATGYNGHIINNITYSSPCPVILIKKNMELNWIGLNKEGKKVEQDISYLDGKWYIGKITIDS